jgi:hypothetical protein
MLRVKACSRFYGRYRFRRIVHPRAKTVSAPIVLLNMQYNPLNANRRGSAIMYRRESPDRLGARRERSTLTRFDFADTMTPPPESVCEWIRVISREAESDMDVRNLTRYCRLLLFATSVHLLMGVSALADPSYTAIDLGTGSPTYGNTPTGAGTITGSNGLTYMFNPVQNDLPAQWTNVTLGVPVVQPTPISGPGSNGLANLGYSHSTLEYMNSQGLAAGINLYGIAGNLANGQAFLTQQQPNGSLGAPIPLWSGAQNFGGPVAWSVGIDGVSSSGQVLGYGFQNGVQTSTMSPIVLYDTKTQTFTNVTSLVNSMTWANSTQIASGQFPNWIVANPIGQLDDQGRILVQAYQGFDPTDTRHNLLLIPDGLSVDPLAIPEPATWVVYTALICGWIARDRLRSRQ